MKLCRACSACFCPGNKGGIGSWGLCVCGFEQTNSSPGHERVMAFLTLVLGEKPWYYANLQVNGILKLLENRGKESPSLLSGRRNMVSVGCTIRTGGKAQTCVINVQCLLLAQSNTLCRHSGSFVHWSFDNRMHQWNKLCGRCWNTNKIFSQWSVIKQKKKKMEGMNCFWELIAQFTFYSGFWRVHETYIFLEMQLICLFFKEEQIWQGKRIYYNRFGVFTSFLNSLNVKTYFYFNCQLENNYY